MKFLPSFRFTRRALRWLGAAALPLLGSTVACAQTPGQQDNATFEDGPAANGAFYAIALQGNGQVLVGGSFTSFRSANRNCIARLNPDGSNDTFNPGLAFGGYNGTAPTVQALAIQADGKILAAGSFTVLNQAGGGGVVRLNADGTLDDTFNVGTGVVDDSGQVGSAYTLAVLPTGQILVGGAFVTFNGVPVAGLVRLDSDGSVDTGFNPGGAGIAASPYGQSVLSLATPGDGTIVIGGLFSAYDGQSANGVARLSADGALDPTFNVGEGVDDGGVNAVAVQANGQVLVGGNFNDFDGIDTVHLVRLNTDGSLDTSYDPSGGSLFISEVDALLVQPDGSLLAGGAFLSQGGLVNSPHNGLAVFLSDGTQDPVFDSGSTALQVVALALQPDGKALAASNPYQLVGSATGNVFRYYDSPAFFEGEVALGGGVFYLSFPNGNYFGFYTFLADPDYVYHYDLGFEYVIDAGDSQGGLYLYDFKSGDFFYTSQTFPFPFLYDFGLNSTVYYYPDPAESGHYNTDGIRYFYVYSLGKVIAL